MRLSKDKLTEITQRSRQSAQAKWFKQFMGVDVPCDSAGPIITESAYEDLVKKRLGLLEYSRTSNSQKERPTVKLSAAVK